MSKIIGFIKANLLIVISVVLILAFLPVGYVFSSGWNEKVHTEADKAYKNEKRKLTSKGMINYQLPAVLEGEADLSEGRAPNAVVTEFYSARKAERVAQVNEVVDRGTAFNQGDHVELVVGLLPKAVDTKAQKRLGREMAEAIAGTEKRASVYQRKLQRLNAGSPPDAGVLAQTITDARDDQQKVYESSNVNGKMTPEQIESLGEDMIARRMGEYVGRAKSLTFYCSADAFVEGSGSTRASEYSVVPSSVPPLSTIDESVVFNWLWDYWMISDVLDAAALANQNPVSGAMAVPEAPVKSIERIRVSKLHLSGADADDTTGSAGAGYGRGPGRGQPSAVVADVTASGTYTGRTGGEANSAFDIRTVHVVVVASSQDLPGFIDAIGKTNYMTVTDVDLEEVDVWQDLEAGFYYGEDHVVRASITIESVWLRSWMTPIMPDQVKTALGIPVATDVDDSEG